jgi:hypothetical protein
MLAKMSRKKAMLAVAIIVIVAATAGTVVAYPKSAVGSQPSQQTMSQPQLQAQVLALNEDDWNSLDEFLKVSDTPIKAHNVTAQSKGWAFQRIDNETIKQYAVELNLTMELGLKKSYVIPIVNVTGFVTIHSTSFNAVYVVKSGKGVVETNKHIALISAEGVDAQNNEVTLKAEVDYLWWGGKVFAFRGRAILRSAENPMLLLLRYGVARVQ